MEYTATPKHVREKLEREFYTDRNGTYLMRFNHIKEKAEDFRRIFGLNIVDFHCPLTGFNIVTFDTAIATPDGISLKEHVFTKYGYQGAALIDHLINSKK